MRKGALLSLLLALAALGAAPATAQDLVGYDGTNPFDCVLQQAGTGTDIPNRDADPLCIEYDKTRQDVSDLSIVEFLSGEPRRFALAGDKCFYFQHDHWRSRVVAGAEATETYSYDGSYFLDRAAGRGGAYAENFTINNQPATDLSPILPDRYDPFFSQGRGGLMTESGIAVEPRCVQLACRGDVYRGEPPAAVAAQCAEAARDDGRPSTGASGDRGDEPGGDGGTPDEARDAPPAGDVRFTEATRDPRFTG